MKGLFSMLDIVYNVQCVYEVRYEIFGGKLYIYLYILKFYYLFNKYDYGEIILIFKI